MSNGKVRKLGRSGTIELTETPLSSFYPYCAYYVDSAAIPESINASDIYDYLETRGTPMDLELNLRGGSRSGWLNLVFIEIAQQYEIAPLHFMCRNPWDEDLCILLRDGEMAAIVASIRFLLERFEAHPEEFIPMDYQSPWEREDILEMLQGAEASLSPCADDGDAPNHFFAFLKSFAAFCEAAMENKKSVMFSQYCEG